MTLVSAIIPTYNRSRLVRRAIDSVLRQTYSNIEVIVIDDGSTDDTQEALTIYGDTIRVVYQSNAGPARARNAGVEVARGSIVAFLDSDDSWAVTKIARQVSLLERAGATVPCCLCNGLIREADDTTSSTFARAAISCSLDEGLWTNVTDVLASRFVFFTQLVAIRRVAFERVGGFNERLTLLEDYELAVRLSLEGPWAFISEPLVTYHCGSPLSLAAAAEADRLRLVGCMVQVHESLCRVLAERPADDRLQRRFLRHLKVSNQLLSATRLASTGGWPASLVGHAALHARRYSLAVYRRSPFYPRMQVAALA